MAICRLPNEMTSYVAKMLDVDDLYNLACTCRRFRGLLNDNNISRHVLESNACASPEYTSAKATKTYAHALRRLAKRRRAIASAQPYMAAVVAVAEQYLYVNGTLLYVLDGQLRILDLHGSSDEEIVVDIRALLDEAIEESHGTKKYTFRVIYYADGIVSCRYKHARRDVESWLVVFDPRQGWAMSQPLESSYKLFVRNNRDFLYYGTHSEVGDDGYRRWVLEGYRFHEDRWFDHKIHLPDMVGSDVGNTICFEIYDNFFYGLSNLTSFDVEGSDWTSYYYCFRFPLDRPRPEWTQLPPRASLWRRKHAEGPIDDRWTFLRLEKSEQSGALTIIESRKEWLVGHSSGRRTYYSKEVFFPPCNLLGNNKADAGGSSTTSGSGGSSAASTTGSSSKGGLDVAGRMEEEEEDEAVLASLSKTGNQTRSPEGVHPGDDSSSMVMFTLTKSYIRSYHSSCSTFLDLVDDPPEWDPERQRLRIRAGSRTLRPPGAVGSPSSSARDDPLYPEREIQQLYADQGIAFWPPEPDAQRPDPRLGDLDLVLHPPGFQGNVRGSWDERSLVYAIGGDDDDSNEIRAVVFISFDPAIRLKGVKRWRGGAPQAEFDQGPRTPLGGTVSGGDSGATTTGPSNKGKEKETRYSRASSLAAGDSDGEEHHVSGRGKEAGYSPTWASVEAAMYGTINGGFDFSY